MIHGGDIYNNNIELDFSINISPLGVPDKVNQGLIEGISDISSYPEYDYRQARNGIANFEGCAADQVLCTNGASEAFMAIVHAFHPKRAVLISPGFYGYEHCLNAVNSKIDYYRLKPENGFSIQEDYLEMLDDNVDMTFIGNPNNPTGKYVEDELLNAVCDRCYSKGITLVLDECFYLFGRDKSNAANLINRYPNVIVVNAFTKICALPGLRVGYLLANQKMTQKIAKQLPEWNVSGLAAKAVVNCIAQLQDSEKLNVLQNYVRTEREFLTRELTKSGIRVYESETNYLLIEGCIDLYDKLLKLGILIRDCSNFKGLDKGYYRIAVMNHEANKRLINALNGRELKNDKY